MKKKIQKQINDLNNSVVALAVSLTKTNRILDELISIIRRQEEIKLKEDLDNSMKHLVIETFYL